MTKRWWSVPIVVVAACSAWLVACSGQSTTLPSDLPHPGQVLADPAHPDNPKYNAIQIDGGYLWLDDSSSFAWFCPASGGKCVPASTMVGCPCTLTACKKMCDHVPAPPGLPPTGVTPCQPGSGAGSGSGSGSPVHTQ